MNYHVKKRMPGIQDSTFNVESESAMFFAENVAQYDLEGRLLEFAAQIIRLVEQLPATRAGNHVAGQILRSGTSPLPNHGEAQAAESRKYFVHKLSISLKKLRETPRWLRLIKRVALVEPPGKIDALLGGTGQLIKIFAASIRTALSKK
jgi:four helix bundle protein